MRALRVGGCPASWRARVAPPDSCAVMRAFAGLTAVLDESLWKCYSGSCQRSVEERCVSVMYPSPDGGQVADVIRCRRND